jgi:hypothetical protein
MADGVDVTNSTWGPNFFQVGPHMTEGVDVTNSTWRPNFFQVGPHMTEGVDVTNSANLTEFLPTWSSPESQVETCDKLTFGSDRERL